LNTSIKQIGKTDDFALIYTFFILNFGKHKVNDPEQDLYILYRYCRKSLTKDAGM